MKFYLIGSLRNSAIPSLAEDIQARLREDIKDIDVFADWFAPGPEADDYWREYAILRGQTYIEALQEPAAKHIFKFDKAHLDTSDGAILALSAGRSAHLEAGYMVGKGKPVWVLLDGVERWDVMYQFCTGVYENVGAMVPDIQRFMRLHRQGFAPE